MSPEPCHGPAFVVNADSSVTFTWCGHGRRVFVEGDFQNAGKREQRYDELHPRKIRMQQGDDGCFQLTTQALVPETYCYRFVVDGKRMADPCNPDTAWQTIYKSNLLTVGGTPQTALYQESARRGQLIHTVWYDRNAERNRRLTVYLPAAYETEAGNGEDAFHVLYLLHGISGNEDSWTERGRLVQIMENLIAEGRAEPMIIVMPDCNLDTCAASPMHQSLWRSVTRYPQLKRDRSLEFAMGELMQYVESTYRVSDRRLIAGLSSGARIAAGIIKNYPDRFEAVGMFSPVVYNEQLPDTKPMTRYYIYTGRNDIFVSNARQFHRRLNRQGIEHTYTETEGAHYWRNWRKYLVEFLQQESFRSPTH